MLAALLNLYWTNVKPETTKSPIDKGWPIYEIKIKNKIKIQMKNWKSFNPLTPLIIILIALINSVGVVSGVSYKLKKILLLLNFPRKKL